MSNNYFTLFDIQPKFDVDLSLLEKKYIELNKAFHPDIVNHEKSLAIENSININKAYEILRSPLKRAEYLLHLLGAKDSKNCNVDPDILEESMQIRESILSGINKQILIKTIEDKIKECIEILRNAFTVKDLSKAISQLHRLKYLNKSYEEVR